MRYQADANRLICQYESGLYGNAIGSFWPGLVTTNTVNDTQNYMEIRALGDVGRSFDSMVLGPNDINGTISMYPQDWRFISWAIGSNVEVSGINYSHIATVVASSTRQSPFTSGLLNPPISFTIVDMKNVTNATNTTMYRTVNGAIVNSVTLNGAQGERMTMDVGWIGQNLTYSSGTAINAVIPTVRPYMWNDAQLTVNGNVLDTAKSFTFTINNNFVGPHYLNGSRVISIPFAGNREMTLAVTLDADSSVVEDLYNVLYRGGSTFTTTLNINAADTIGSSVGIITLSGCYMTNCTIPSPSEGVNEMTIEMSAPTIIGSFFDRIKYNPW